MGLEFRMTFPKEMPTSVPVYRLQRPAAFPLSVVALGKVAQQMGLAGRPGEVCISEDWTSYREGLHHLSMHGRSGALRYVHRERYARQGEKAFALSDQEAETIAERFLDRTGLVSRGERRTAAVTHLRTAGAATEGEARSSAREVLLDAGVVFRRLIDGVPVEGPGGQTMVHVDPEGEISGFEIIWRSVAEPVEDVKVLPPDRAYAVMKEIAGRVRGDVEVTRAAFGYFEQGRGEAQTYLQPAYAMVYVVRDGEVAFKSAEVVAAAERVFEPLRGEKRFAGRPQPPRKTVR